MASNPEGPASASIVERVKRILIEPKAEWPRIDAEPATTQGLFTSYVMILSAIPIIATAVALILLMPRLPGVYGYSTMSILAGMIVQYLLGLAGVYVMALIIEALAPSFGGTKDRLKALKVAAYYPTAVWVAGAALIVPLLGFLILLAGLVYSFYLLYLGLPVLMKVAQDKVGGYFVAILLISIVVFYLINLIGQRVIYGGIFY